MAEAESRGIGYLGWSWSGNGGGVEYLDQVTNFNPNQLTSWGTRLFNGANGIASTAEECTMCGGGTQPTDTTPPTTPAPRRVLGQTSSGASLTWTASTDTRRLGPGRLQRLPLQRHPARHLHHQLPGPDRADPVHRLHGLCPSPGRGRKPLGELGLGHVHHDGRAVRHHRADHPGHPDRVRRDLLRRLADLDRLHRQRRLGPGRATTSTAPTAPSSAPPRPTPSP